MTHSQHDVGTSRTETVTWPATAAGYRDPTRYRVWQPIAEDNEP